MRALRFNEVFEETVQKSSDVLVKKAGEYADDTDRLLNFKKSAGMRNTTPIDALGGMLIKHTTSIYDYIETSKLGPIRLELWDEKIIDHINYLILLRALVVEEIEGKQNA